jgi:hypothetical protein
MKTHGMSGAQYALWLRIATTLLKMGCNEDGFENFILDVYECCEDVGLSPQSISSYLQDLVEFSSGRVPISKIEGLYKGKEI